MFPASALPVNDQDYGPSSDVLDSQRAEKHTIAFRLTVASSWLLYSTRSLWLRTIDNSINTDAAGRQVHDWIARKFWYINCGKV